MRWWDPGLEAALRALADDVSGRPFGEPPPGFERLGPARPMRVVLAGALPGGERVVLKWSRPVTRADRLRRRLFGGKGVREGRLLRRLAARGVPAPRVLGYCDEGADLLVVEHLDRLAPLPEASLAPRALVVRVATRLGEAFRAGLRHRDLHPGNLALRDGEPVFLDLGGARLARGGGLLREAGRLGHAFLGDASRTRRLRAFCAWLAGAGRRPAPRARRRLARRAGRAVRRRARRYRRGRDRRATRSGRHFEVFARPGGVRGVRRRDGPEAWREGAGDWLDRDPPGARPLKAGGRVLEARLPGSDAPVVLKRFGPIRWPRRPRPLTAFGRAVALDHRGISVPRPLLAAAAPDGSGYLLSSRLEGRDLLGYSDGGRQGALPGLEPACRRRLLVRLGRFLRTLHEAEVSHRDLKAPNLLLRPEAGGGGFAVTDLEGARVHRRGVSWRRRARDLARLDASLDATAADRRAVLAAYLAPLPRPPVSRRRFLGWIARAVAAKRGPSGRPR